MTPSFIGRYAIISSGVRPIISFASFPTASILLSCVETATTEGSLRTIPFPGTNTRTEVVPRSMPSFGANEKAIMERHYIALRDGRIAKGCFIYLPALFLYRASNLFWFYPSHIFQGLECTRISLRNSEYHCIHA